MKKLKGTPLPGEPDRAFEYAGRAWRVRVKSHRTNGASVFQISVAALNDDKSVHQNAGIYTITDPHVLTFMDTTKASVSDEIERVTLELIKECQLRLENQKATDEFMKEWSAGDGKANN